VTPLLRRLSLSFPVSSSLASLTASISSAMVSIVASILWNSLDNCTYCSDRRAVTDHSFVFRVRVEVESNLNSWIFIACNYLVFNLYSPLFFLFLWFGSFVYITRQNDSPSLSAFEGASHSHWPMSIHDRNCGSPDIRNQSKLPHGSTDQRFPLAADDRIYIKPPSSSDRG
jgi:hypothetical protein